MEWFSAHRSVEIYGKNRINMSITSAIWPKIYEFTSSRKSNFETLLCPNALKWANGKSIAYNMPFSVEINPIMYTKLSRKSMAASSFVRFLPYVCF